MTAARKVRVISALILTVVVLIVGFQNSEPVSVNLLFWHFSMSKLMLIVGCFLLGGLAGGILALFAGRSKPVRG